MNNVKYMGWMLELMSIHEKDNSRTLKSNFFYIVSYFQGLNPNTSNHKWPSLGVFLETHEGVIERSITLGFHPSNNEAEYKALIYGLEVMHMLRRRLYAYSNL